MNVQNDRTRALSLVLPVLAAMLLAPSSAHAIIDGTFAAPCAFPSVVRLESTRSNSVCTGVYIGGRVMITAAHCFANDGYQLDHDVIEARTGATPDPCTAASDCPSVMIAGELTGLLCQGAPFTAHPAAEGECYLPELEYNNDHLSAYFGESHAPYGEAHPGNIIPIQYCHINPGYNLAPNDERQDFAYCILAEAPDLQPVPIMMPCEVDSFLQGDLDLDVMIAGFGIGSQEPDTQDGKPGRKRWATSTTDFFAFSSSDTELSLPHFSEFMPGNAAGGDSGGPVFIKLPPPHNTWRVFGTFVKPLLAVPPWQFVDWMLQDPEVEAAKILPCHDVDGNWGPGAECQGFPLAPQTASGGWSYGPRACDSKSVGGVGTACGPGFPNPILPPGSPDSSEPVSVGALAAAPGATSNTANVGGAGCSASGDELPLGLLLTLLPLLGFSLRRQRQRGIAAGCVLFAVVGVGCSGDEISDGGDGTGAETGGELPPAPIVLNPFFHDVHSGLALPGAGYDQLALGNVARGVGDTSCCQDVVVGGPDSPWVHVYFGGGSIDHGFTFLDPRPVQQYDMASPGAGVRDIALVDLDGDGYNDLLAVTSDGQLGVRRGVDGSVSQTYFDALTLYDASAGVTDDLGPLALGDLDCDAELDVAIAAPGGRGIVSLRQQGGAVFGSAAFTATLKAADANKAGRPRDLAIGNFDDVGAKEIVSVNDDGTLTIYSRKGCNGAISSAESLVFYPVVGGCDGEVLSCVNDTAVVHVLTDDVYCATPLDDVTVAFADRVQTYCNQGDFNPTLENLTLSWDLNGQGKPNLMVMRDIAWWSQAATLYASDGRNLRQMAAPGTLFFDSDTPKVTQFVKATELSEFVLSRHVDDAGQWWQRLTWVGTPLPDSELGFAR